jgi:DNA ligase (NAD+)
MMFMQSFDTKASMSFVNVGDSTVELLIDTGLLTSFTDFYELTQDKLVATGRVSKREAERIMDGINATRSNYLNQLLNALGIEDIGRTASAELADHFATLSAINDAVFNNPIEIESVGKVGVVAANNLIAWFKVNRDVVKYFITNSIGVQAKKKLVTGDALVGLTLIMTGKSSIVGRDEFKTLVQQYGGKVSSSISGKVDYVLLGDGAGPSKVKQIQEIQREGGKIKTITDEEFLKMIGR